MAEQASSANWNAETPQLGMPALWRLAAWGVIATLALFAAAISAYSNAGSLRQAAASASSSPASSGQGTTLQSRIPSGEFGSRPSETVEETRRLAEAVHTLAADRDQVLGRLAALERNLDGVTGTIKRDRIASAQPTAAPTLPQSPPPVAAPAASAAPIAGAAPVASPAPTASAAPVARPEPPAARPETQVTRPETPAAPVAEIATTTLPAPASQQSGPGDTAPDASNRVASAVRTGAPPEPPLAAAAGLGVDVGGAANYEGLRALWHATRNADPAMLEDLYPVVTVRENGKTHGVELRLVVGPIADVDTASRLCTTLSAAKHYCQPVSFEGQRLSLVDTGPPKATPTTVKAPPSSHHSSSPSEPPQHPKSFNWK
jgi:hypothetical protein